MTTEVAEATLIELFEAAAGDGAEVILPDGRRISQLGMFGVICIDGKPSEGDEVRFRLAQDLRQAARDVYLSPATNPMIKLD